MDIRSEINAQVNFVGSISDVTPAPTSRSPRSARAAWSSPAPTPTAATPTVREGVLVVRNPNALGSSVSPTGDTIVFAGAALELQSDLAAETIRLNGDGFPFNGHNTGALRNVSNNNTFTGTLILATNSTIGVDSGSQLTIGTKAGLAGTGTIDDTGIRSLTKELTGTLVLNAANTYDGVTDVIQGILRIEHGAALGHTANGTQVRNGAQFQLANNITVSGETLTLSGTGIIGTGVLQNLSGNNTWQGPINFTGLQGLAAPPPPLPPTTISIGVVGANDTLTISGPIGETVVTIPAQPPGIPTPVTLSSFGLTKVLAGKLILSGASDNTYSGVTTVQTGVLNIQKPQALGTPGAGPNNGTVVNAGAALETEGNITYVAETVTLNGTGTTTLGALRNVAGNNTWTGAVVLNSTVPVAGGANPVINIGADGSSSLTISGSVEDPASVPGTNKAAELHKVGPGTIVLPNANTYQGRTFIDTGVVNIRHAGALGASGSASNDTTVVNGGTLQVQGGITVVSEVLTINGQGGGGQGALRQQRQRQQLGRHGRPGQQRQRRLQRRRQQARHQRAAHRRRRHLQHDQGRPRHRRIRQRHAQRLPRRHPGQPGHPAAQQVGRRSALRRQPGRRRQPAHPDPGRYGPPAHRHQRSDSRRHLDHHQRRRRARSQRLQRGPEQPGHPGRPRPHRRRRPDDQQQPQHDRRRRGTGRAPARNWSSAQRRPSRLPPAPRKRPWCAAPAARWPSPAPARARSAPSMARSPATCGSPRPSPAPPANA